MVKLNSRQSALLLVVGGLASGFLNGLLGAGGGILAVLVLSTVLSSANRDPSSPADRRDVFANALASMLPTAAVSAARYAAHGAIRIENALTYVLPAIAGGLAGALLLDRLPVTAVRRTFIVITIFSGIVMLLRD